LISASPLNRNPKASRLVAAGVYQRRFRADESWRLAIKPRNVRLVPGKYRIEDPPQSFSAGPHDPQTQRHFAWTSNRRASPILKETNLRD